MRAIEVYHSDHSPENVSYYQSLAERFQLGMTGGSDFHGANKPKIALGSVAIPDDTLEKLKALVC